MTEEQQPPQQKKMTFTPGVVNTDKLLQTEKTSADYYWNSYAHFGIHEEMLKDTVRTLSYKKAIVNNPHLFKGKTVLDVGCGTGILSLFAVKAGAKHVYAVDCSDIIHQCQQIVNDNNFSDKITCIQCKVEDLVLPVEKVDIIVSEWMGYFLLYESMLNTVLIARDKFLAPDGIMMPDQANLYLAGIEDADYKEEKISFWDDVYGYNFSCIKEIAYREPLVDTVNGNAVVTSACKILTLDLYTCKESDLTFEHSYICNAARNDYMHAFIAWFDIKFTKCHKPIYFTTSPSAKYTHWKQTVFYLKDTLTISTGDQINGKITVTPNKKNHRDLDIIISVDFDGAHNSVHTKQEYLLR